MLDNTNFVNENLLNIFSFFVNPDLFYFKRDLIKHNYLFNIYSNFYKIFELDANIF